MQAGDVFEIPVSPVAGACRGRECPVVLSSIADLPARSFPFPAPSADDAVHMAFSNPGMRVPDGLAGTTVDLSRA